MAGMGASISFRHKQHPTALSEPSLILLRNGVVAAYVDFGAL